MKKTLVLGASTHSYRYSHTAANRLISRGIEVVLVGHTTGSIQGYPIHAHWPDDEDIHTVTMYLSVSNQIEYYDRILHSGIKRLIFNPGSENIDLAAKARDAGIEVEEACTLVMLAANQY